MGHYPTNYLIGRGPLPKRPLRGFGDVAEATPRYAVLAPVSQGYPPLGDRLATRYSPVCRWESRSPPRTTCMR